MNKNDKNFYEHELEEKRDKIMDKFKQHKEDAQILETIVNYDDKLFSVIKVINLLLKTEDQSIYLYDFDMDKIAHSYNGFEDVKIYWFFPLTKEAVYSKQAINNKNLSCTLAFVLNIRYNVNSGEMTGKVTDKTFDCLFAGFPDINQKLDIEKISFENFSKYTIAHIVNRIREVYETKNLLKELEEINLCLKELDEPPIFELKF